MDASKYTRKDICSFEKDNGPCKQGMTKWFFNFRKQECQEFAYGGCQGNANNFDTKKDCEKICDNGKDVCSFPKNGGSCDKALTNWYFNSQTEKCVKFTYGGCEGNANNFRTKEACETKCFVRSGKDICSLGSNAGSCKNNVKKWFYNYNKQECQEFVYGGCKGNANNFNTKKACEKKCDNGKDVCSFRKNKGECTKKLKNWYFNSKKQKCMQFTYGGCKGNANNFTTKAACEAKCHKP